MKGPEIDVVLDGAVRRARLRMPSIGETHVLVADPSLRRSADTREQALRLQLLDLLETLDGEPMTLDLATRIAHDGTATAALLTAQAGWVRANVDGGVVAALCPHCRRGEWKGTLHDLAAVLGTSMRPIVSDDGELFRFTLSYLPDGQQARPAEGAAAGIRFTLPRAGGAAVEGTVDRIDPEEEATAWRRWARIGQDPLSNRDDWTYESAGFRAVLRARCALTSLCGRPLSDLTPTDVEELTLAEFCFLDELYRLAFLTAKHNASTVQCAKCGGRFSPAQ